MLSYIEYSLLLREQADTDGLADEEELTILGQLPQLIADYEFQLVDVVADDVHLWCHSVVVGNGLLACVLDLVGHLTGVDEFLNVGLDGLRALGNLLLDFGVSRKIDFYRYGGDEFVGLVRDPGTDLSKLSSDLLSEIRKVCVKYGNVEIPLTACIGITSDGKDCQTMINNADKAMYLAKHHGKNQGCTV